MLRRYSLLIWCMLLAHNIVHAKTNGPADVTASKATTVVVQKVLNLDPGSSVTISSGAAAEGVVAISSGAYAGSNGTTVGSMSGSVNIANSSITANSSSNLSNINNNGSITLSGFPVLSTLTGGTGTFSLTPGTNAEINGNVTTSLVVTSGATVTASGPLKIGDNNSLLTTAGTSCTLGANGQSITLGVLANGTQAAAHLTLCSMCDMDFLSKIVLTGEWTFTGNANVTGNGNILDISLGGTIRINPNSSVSFSDLKLRGLGIGKIIFDDPTAQLRTSFIEIEMNRNYSFTTGGIYAEGPTNIVTKNNILRFSNASSLTVDGIALTYDTTTFTDQQNIRPVVAATTSKNITKLNNGVIRQLNNVDYISQNSNAIVNLSNIVRADSNAFAYGIKNNSNALLYCCRTSSNAIVKLDRTERTNSNAFAFGIKNNSNAIVNITNAIVVVNQKITNNSNAIIKLDRTERTNSNAFAFGIKNNSNAILFANRTTSNAILYANRTTSNAILYANRTTSNAIIKLNVTERTNSNAFAFGIKNNSNAIVNITNEIVVLNQRITNNSNAIIKLDRTERTNSNAFAFGIKNLSNALLYSNRTTSNAILYANRTTSNALLYCCRTSSNAIVNLTNILRVDSNAFAYGIKNNSNALKYGIKNNSNALLYGIKNNSNALLYGIKNNSNALKYGIKNNSNALLYGIKNNSNALLYGIKNNSNALKYGIHNNSQAIVWLDIQLQTIDHGPLPVDITQTTTSLSFDLYLSSEHKMFVTVNSTLDGHGHYIHFSNDRSNVLNIAAGKTLVLKNVVLKGFSQAALGLGINSNIIFGDGTLIELFADPDLSMTWTFEGQTTLSGQGEQLNLKAPQGNIFVSGAGSALLFDNIVVAGVSGNNIRCTDNHSTLSFYDTTWILDGNYTLTKGRFEVLSTFDLVGSYTFGYGTLASSIIQPNATLLLDIGSTFSYTPLSNNRDLLTMFDASSRLYMNGATLASTTTGLRLTNGTLIVDKRNYLHNDHAAALSQGISFGNGSSVNDLSVVIIPGANIDLVSGVLDYQNSN